MSVWWVGANEEGTSPPQIHRCYTFPLEISSYKKLLSFSTMYQLKRSYSRFHIKSFLVDSHLFSFLFLGVIDQRLFLSWKKPSLSPAQEGAKVNCIPLLLTICNISQFMHNKSKSFSQIQVHTEEKVMLKTSAMKLSQKWIHQTVSSQAFRFRAHSVFSLLIRRGLKK